MPKISESKKSLAERYHKVRNHILKTFESMQLSNTADWSMNNWAKKNPKEFYDMAVKVLPREQIIDANIKHDPIMIIRSSGKDEIVDKNK